MTVSVPHAIKLYVESDMALMVGIRNVIVV